MPALENPVRVGAPVSQSASIAAPTGGWNTRDPLAAMSDKYAIKLDNWIPREKDIALRKGQENWTTGYGADLTRFLKYTGLDAATRKLFVVSGTNVYDASSAGVIGAAVTTVTDPTDWMFINFATTGGIFLIAANGHESPQYYDGTTWHVITGVSAPYAITGIATTGLFYPITFKRRIYFLNRASRDVWILPVNAVAGAAINLNLGPLFRDGGYLVAQGTWTVDAGDGPEDYIVFVTSEGQVAVYEGTDPGVAGDFRLVGLYKLPKPVGPRPLQQFGGDLLILTEQGVLPLSKSLQSATITNKVQVTDKIAPSFVQAAKDFGSATTWCMQLHTPENLLIVNVPQGAAHHQYVMNTITGAWCRFLGFESVDWVEFQGKLLYAYGGAGRKIVRALTGNDDFDADIGSEIHFAFSYMGSRDPVRVKHSALVRPQMTVSNPIKLNLAIASDFDPSPAFFYASMDALLALLSNSLWDSAIWDLDLWGFDTFNSLEWQTVPTYPGFTWSFCMQVFTMQADVSLVAVDFVYQEGMSL